MLLTALVLMQQAAAAAPPDSAALRHADGRVPRAMVAARVTRGPTIDGRLDDEAWRTATPAGGFRQMTPHEGEPASESTLVWIVYDAAAIYVGARLFDSEPDKIERRLGRRDGFLESDMFFVNFDSYHDHRTAFEFAVTPTGVRQDDITSNDFFLGDRSWEPVWQVATAIDTLGWTAEMRIPFSQLRFPQADEQVWGVQFFRNVFRKNEQSQFEFKLQTESGYASRFAHLLGIRGVAPPRQIEVLPYVVARGTARPVTDPADPFVDAREYFGGAGLDAKYGVTSNLTLDATINPDFGQVESDPAFVNLSAFEQFFEERRPFFVEGANIFEFNANSGFIGFGGTPRLFYSRRIGRNPHGYPAVAGYVDEPTATTILGAAKLTGKSAGGWSLGLLNALTAREYATVDTGGPRYHQEVEPLTNYLVGRLRREFRGSSGLGFLATAVQRDLREPTLRDALHRTALVGAVDFFHRWAGNAYSLSGSFGASRVSGDTLALQATQLASSRYFLRPDQDRVRYQSDRTALTGWTGDVYLNKEGGSTNWALAASASSPGFEVNDLGFQTRVDRASAAWFLGHRWTRPGTVFRQASVSASGGPSWNWDGDLIGHRLGVFHFAQFLNYWGYQLNLGYGAKAFDDRLTRGGPVTVNPASWSVGAGLFSDGRKRIQLNVFTGYNRSSAGGWSVDVFPNVGVRPSGAVQLNIGPSLSVGRSAAQFVGAVPDTLGLAPATYDTHYLFARLDARSVDITLRLNVTMSPTLSLQTYVQPFAFAGDYAGFKELAAPRTFRFLRYGVDGTSTDSVLSRDTRGRAIAYALDPDGPGGPADAIVLANPDFHTRSLQSNAVLRWEYRPGSTLFVVWTMNRSGFTAYEPSFDSARDIADLLLFRRFRPTNTLLVKLNYWLSL